MKVTGPDAPVLQQKNPAHMQEMQARRAEKQDKHHERVDSYRSAKRENLHAKMEELRAKNPEKFAELGRDFNKAQHQAGDSPVINAPVAEPGEIVDSLA